MVRPARIDEADAIAAAYEWLFAAPGAPPEDWDPAVGARRLRDAIEGPRSTVLVVEDGGAITGLCTVYLEFESVRYGRRAWVEDLAVDPAQRSRGAGKALLEAARAWARDAGAAHLKLESGVAREDAHRFYEREAPATRSLSFGWTL